MMEAEGVEIDATRRIARLRGAASGGVITGTDKVRSGFGNGDCILLDFIHGVFAVADGSERFPWASRDLLLRLRGSLSRSGAPDSLEGWIAMLNEEVYPGQKYQHKTTFSCVAVAGGGDGRTLFIAHGGDSAVTIVDPSDGTIMFQTGRDMNFAGRSTMIADCTEHRIRDRGLRVVLSTDGFNDLLRYCKKHAIYPRLSRVLADVPVDSIPEEMHRVLGEHRGSIEHDDIGLVVIDPFALGAPRDAAVLIGGTRPHEESRYQAASPDADGGSWEPGERWADRLERFEEAGILVQRSGD